MIRKSKGLKQSIFSLDNKLMSTCAAVYDMVLLNFVFLIFCIPIFTVGSATAALYSVTLKAVQDEKQSIILAFWKSFKSNFKQGSILGILGFLGTILIYINLNMVNNLPDSSFEWIKVVCYAVFIILLCTLLYAYPMCAQFDTGIKQILYNSFVLSFLNIQWTVLLVLMILPIFFLIFHSIFTMLLCITVLIFGGCSSIALIQSHIFCRVFKKYMPESDS